MDNVVIRQNSGRLASLLLHCYGYDFGEGQGNFSPSVQVPSDSNQWKCWVSLPKKVEVLEMR